MKFILTILNSKIANYILKNNPFSKKDTFPQIRLHWLKDFPLKEANIESKQSLIKRADELLNLNRKYYDTKYQFLTVISSNFFDGKIPNKIKLFPIMSFEEFKKILIKSSKHNISFTKEQELIKFFDDNRLKLLELKGKIEKTDYDIDKMVYDIYGLTDDEIKIIEDSIK